MEDMEVSARTVEEAIQQALEQLGIGREEVEVTILKESKRSVLGLGGEDARIRVRPLVPVSNEESDVVEVAKGVLESLLSSMGVSASVVQRVSPPVEEGEEETPVTFDIEGDDLGILIGRRGQTLASLQYIVRLILAQKTRVWVPVVVDVEGYKQRRYQSLQTLASRMAEEVTSRKMPFALEPMPAYERRIIHLALSDSPDVTTESIGAGEMRKVVILPRE